MTWLPRLHRCLTRALPVLLLGSVLSVVGATEAQAHPGGGASCRSSLPAGDSTVDVVLDGVHYPVLVYVPVAATGARKVPLVLDLHGSQNNGRLQLLLSDMRREADVGGFVVAAPNGAVPFPREPDIPDDIFAWNVPGVTTVNGGAPPAGTRDDVRFLAQVATTLQQTACVDPARVYGTGYSGGGRMISALACARPGLLAAIAPVAGLRAGRPSPTDPTRPVAADCAGAGGTPVLTFQGQADPVNPFEGGGAAYWQYSVPTALQTWAGLNNCRTTPRSNQVSQHVVRLTYLGCRRNADVTAFVISDGGHTWPGGPTAEFPDYLGKVSQEVNASDLIWAFFAPRHS